MRGTQIQVNRSFLRPVLFCGAERKAVSLYGLLSLMMAATTHFLPPGIIIAPIFFLGCHLFFVWVAKQDPQMVEIYKRHTVYKQGYFPARGGALATPGMKVKPTVTIKKDKK